MSASRRALNLNRFLLDIQQHREWTETDLKNKILHESLRSYHSGIALRININKTEPNYTHDDIKKLNNVFKQTSPNIYFLNICKDLEAKTSNTFWMGQVLNDVNLSYTVLTLYHFSLKDVYQFFQDIDKRPCLARSVRFVVHPDTSKQEALDIADLITSEYNHFYSALSITGYEKNSMQEYFTQQLAKFSRLRKIPLDTMAFSRETPNLKELFEQFYYNTTAPLASASSAAASVSASMTQDATINALKLQIQALHQIIAIKTDENNFLQAENADLNYRVMTSEYNQAILLAQFGLVIDWSQEMSAPVAESVLPTTTVVVPNDNSVASLLYRNMFAVPSNAVVVNSENYSVEEPSSSVLNGLR
jgi:hypothetical protein